MSYLRARALSGSLALVAAFPLIPFPVNCQQHTAAHSFPYMNPALPLDPWSTTSSAT